MNTRTTLLKQALLVLLLVPWAPDHFNLSNTAVAQSDALVTGKAFLNLLNGDGTPQALPIPGGAHTYTGNIATRSQVVRGDGNGNILFDVIDGNVYDGDGYLIADGLGVGCQECLHPGCMEMLAVPVPGNCDLFYLLTMNSKAEFDDGNSYLQVSLLDLSAPNPYHAGRYGHVWPYQEIAAQRPELAAWSTELWLSQISDTEVPGWIPMPNGNHKAGAPRMRIIDPIGDGSHYFLYAILSTTVITYEITGFGIFLVNQDLDGQISTFDGTAPGSTDSYSRDADVAMGPNGEIMLTLAGKGLDVWVPTTGGYSNVDQVPLLIMRFDAGTGAIQEITGVPLNGANGSPDFSFIQNVPLADPVNTVVLGLKGCAIVDGGNGLILTGERGTGTTTVPCVGRWDLNGAPWIDLGVQFNMSPLSALARTRVHRANFPGTQEQSLLFPMTNGLAALRGIDNTATMQYEALYPLTGDDALPIYTPGALVSSNIETAPVFLNTQITNDNFAAYFASTTEGECCLIREASGGQPGLTLVNSDPWSATSNPFGNQSEVTFTGDLVVPAGMHLYVSNMTLRFAPNAKLIVQRGGKANFLNTKLTSLLCTDLRWPGIRVEGNTANPYQDNNPNLPIGQEQAWLVLSGNSIVENARYGVWCAREFESDNPDPAYYGGVVRASNSRFINCLRGVQVEHYHRFDANNPQTGTELPNRSQFLGCHFETNAAWPSGTPGWMAFVDDIRGVKFTSCSFENSAPQLFPPDETGGGIFMFNSITWVDGNNNPTSTYFRNLRFGVLNSSGIYHPVRVAKMHFENNVIGIADMGSTYVNYSQNTFDVADQGNAPNARIGMLLWQTQIMIVEQNTFSGAAADRSVGIYFVGIAAPVENDPEPDWVYLENRIYNNTFTHLAAGNLVKDIHRGNANSDVDAGLQLLCGDYTDNTFDIAVLAKSLVRPDQGITSQVGQNKLAGNRFYNNADCSANFDWALDAAWRDIPSYAAMVIDYKRHELPDDLIGVSCDLWDGFDDLPVPFSGMFVKTDHCSGGAYPIPLTGTSNREIAYLQAKSLLTAAISTFEGTVDLGHTMELKEAILQDNPWLPSANLRDRLLAKHPLSDEVLKIMLDRTVPMDPWHLTQVLLQNSKLNPGILDMVRSKALLAPFFQSMVDQAQHGTGFTTKQVLEQEIVQRRLEMTEHLAVLGQLYAMDTIGSPTDSLKKLLLYDKDKQFLKQRIETLIKLGRFAEAQALLDGDFATQNGKEVMEDLLAMEQSTAGVWKDLSTTDKGKLDHHAAHGKSGAAQAAGILYSIAYEAPLPQVSFPALTKSRGITGPQPTGNAVTIPTVNCFPNPSNTNAFLSYPGELDGTQVVVYDAKGSAVATVRLYGNGLVELDTRAWRDGVYNVVLPGTAYSTKLSVQH